MSIALQSFTGNFKYIEDINNPGNNVADYIIMIDNSGDELIVPFDDKNSQYILYLEWIADGNTPLAYD